MEALQKKFPNNRFANLLSTLHHSPTPHVPAQIAFVLVLSGRSDVVGTILDKGIRAKRDDKDIDSQDDRNRLGHGIDIANLANAKRAGKPVTALTEKDQTVPIFYNGTPAQNEALRQALQGDTINYPRELFIIKDIQPQNTQGQIACLENYLRGSPSDLPGVPPGQAVKCMAVVTSAYHAPRTGLNLSRNPLEPPYLKYLSKTKFYLYGHDKRFQMPGVATHDLFSEVDAMTNYASSSNTEQRLAETYSANVLVNPLLWEIRSRSDVAKFTLALVLSTQFDRSCLPDEDTTAAAATASPSRHPSARRG